MTFINVLAMTTFELLGNAHLKWFAENDKQHHLGLGIVAWMIVLLFLIESLRKKSMIWTCIMWEAAIVVGGALVAFFIFGEKLKNWVQWLGILLALGAAVCINYECKE